MDRIELEKYIAEQECGRNIRFLILHCSATKRGRDVSVKVIDRWHAERGFKRQPSGAICGYHFVILENGEIEVGRTPDEVGAHCAGMNTHSIGVCYAGGLDDNGRPADTRTQAQRDAMLWLLERLKKRFAGATIRGHRDFNVHKACPCFDAGNEYGILR